MESCNNLFLKEIPFVVECLKFKNNKRVYVFIDLALSAYFNAQQRLNYIQTLASTVRKTTKPNYILFQGYDESYIRETIKTDGEIYILNNKLYKQKALLTVDLKYNLTLNGMIDRDGSFYNLINNYRLEDGVIYECLLDNSCKKVKQVLKQRRDKFYPNSAFTVASIYSFSNKT